MAHPTHVPDPLTRAPFRGSWAVDHGLLSRRQLDSGAWVRILRDVYRFGGLLETDEVRAAALRLVLPADAVVCGRTAAWLHGVWTPVPGAPIPLEFARHTMGSGEGLIGARKRRLALMPTMLDDVAELRDGCFGDLVLVRGVPATSALRTCFELVRDRPLVEAVVVADAFAYSGALTLPWLHAYVQLHRGWPGVRQAREVVELASSYARSSGESRLRMIVVLGALPEPHVNVGVWAEGSGTLIGIPDLTLTRVPRPAALEYDGAYHGHLEQRVADIGRENRFALESSLPLLRFGRNDVRLRYHATLRQIVRATGVTHWRPLEDRHFRRSSRDRMW